jgi:hypothetical protein
MVHMGVCMASITLHKLDPELERCLREQARSLNMSLNRTAQKLLKEALGVSRSGTKKNDFSALAGTWTREEAAEFEDAVADFAKIDEEMWQ